jgi:hypothetical protein
MKPFLYKEMLNTTQEGKRNLAKFEEIAKNMSLVIASKANSLHIQAYSMRAIAYQNCARLKESPLERKKFFEKAQADFDTIYGKNGHRDSNDTNSLNRYFLNQAKIDLLFNEVIAGNTITLSDAEADAMLKITMNMAKGSDIMPLYPQIDTLRIKLLKSIMIFDPAKKNLLVAEIDAMMHDISQTIEHAETSVKETCKDSFQGLTKIADFERCFSLLLNGHSTEALLKLRAQLKQPINQVLRNKLFLLPFDNYTSGDLATLCTLYEEHMSEQEKSQEIHERYIDLMDLHAKKEPSAIPKIMNKLQSMDQQKGIMKKQGIKTRLRTCLEWMSSTQKPLIQHIECASSKEFSLLTRGVASLSLSQNAPNPTVQAPEIDSDKQSKKSPTQERPSIMSCSTIGYSRFGNFSNFSSQYTPYHIDNHYERVYEFGRKRDLTKIYSLRENQAKKEKKKATESAYHITEHKNPSEKIQSLRTDIMNLADWFYRESSQEERTAGSIQDHNSDYIILDLKESEKSMPYFLTHFQANNTLGYIFYSEACCKLDCINKIMSTIIKSKNPSTVTINHLSLTVDFVAGTNVEYLCAQLWRHAISVGLLLSEADDYGIPYAKKLAESIVEQAENDQTNMIMKSLKHGIELGKGEINTLKDILETVDDELLNGQVPDSYRADMNSTLS